MHNRPLIESVEPRRLLAFSAAINFAPTGAARAPGLLADYGARYGVRRSGTSYGWSSDVTANAVERNATKVQRNDTFIAMQQGGDATWSIAVPSGNYSVYIVAGDPSAVNDRMSITAQGQIVVSGITKKTRHYLEGTAVVNVNNGQLLIGNGADAVNNKIDYIVVQSTDATPNSLFVRANAPATTEGATTSPGAFTITRSGDLDSVLTVPLAIGGSATNAIDYGRIGTKVTFAAGVSKIKLPVRAVDDETTEGNETATLSLGEVGGYQLGTSSATVTISDADSTPPPTISSVSWGSTTSLPQGKSEAFGTTVGDTLYVFGGYVNTNYVPSTSAYKFNATTHTWSQIASLPTGTTQAGQAADGRYIYFAGGHIATSSTSQTFSTAAAYRYDTQTDTYASLPNLPAARGPGGLALVGRTIYFIGGSNSSRADVATVYALDLDNTGAGWTTKASLPAAENRLGVAVLGGKIYAVGGQTNYDNNAVHRNSLYRYDPATNTWTTLHNLPLNVSHNNASVFVAGGTLFSIAGEGDGLSKLSTVTSYDPTADAWTNFTSIPAGRISMVAAITSDNNVIVTGGFNSTFQTQTYVGTFA